MDPQSPAWGPAWEGLAEVYGFDVKRRPGLSGDCAECCGGECWQMMGAYQPHGEHDRLTVEFRHRSHPRTGAREYRRVRLSRDTGGRWWWQR